MGWFTRSGPKSPEKLRDQLFEAVAKRDGAQLDRLIDEHRDAVKQHFASWQKVPEELRSDRERVQRYANGLMAVAQLFERRGDGSLMAALTGSQGDNALARWEQALESAQQAVAERRYAQAEAMLSECVTAAKGLSGSGVDYYLPFTLGQLAQCRFHLGRVAEALPLFEQALALCRRTKDVEGQIAYLSSLHEAHRWLGDSARAIEYAQALAALCNQTGQRERARQVERHASLMRAGEPLLRVLAELGGRTLELEELRELPSPPPDGPVRFQFVRNRISLGGVTALVQDGSRLGSAGEHTRALSAFEAASALDPTDPEPVYLAALTLLELGRYHEAVGHYDRVEQLAPGWYRSRANRWLAVELAAGRVAPSVFATTRAIQDGALPASERERLAQATLAHHPSVPILHLLHAQALFELGSTAAAAHAAHTGLQLQPDIDVQTRLLLALALASPPGQRRPALHRAIALDGNKTAAAMAQLVMRAEPSHG